jgi:HPt (histidine-containing phosphotransfer) domain-containing protein
MGERVELDLERVANLESILGSDLPEILASLGASMSARIAQAEEALADDRLADVTQAAHACRNDALMVGAQPLLAALSELEDASRGDRLEDAHAAMHRLREVWPETRSELQRAVHSAVNGD